MEFVCAQPMRLDHFLVQQLPEHSRSAISSWIRGGRVRVQGEVARKSGMALGPGARVTCEPPPPPPKHDLVPFEAHLEVLFEDQHLMVVLKPRGMATHPAPTLRDPSLVNVLLARKTHLSTEAGDFRPGIVHRLDKATSGLLMVAKSDPVHRKLAEQIRLKEAERRYFAWVEGRPELERFAIDAPLGKHPRYPMLRAVRTDGKPAVTQVRRLRSSGSRTLLSLRLETGRTHQIRVHLAASGMPVLGDRLYAPKQLQEGPLQLHAGFLAFRHPETGERVARFAPPPEDFLDAGACTREELESWT